MGKYGVAPDEDATDAGPFDRWPTGKGFDRFFGFLGSQTDQYKPDLVEDQAHVRTDGCHLSAQITDKAIVYVDRQKKVAPDKPFFLYYAPGATHAPHQVDKYWSDQYKGKFDKGWDAYREEVFERQKKLGIIPANAKLPERNPDIKAWDQLSPDKKKLYARFMEVYAGYLTYTDYEVGRLINHLKEINQLNNTLVFISIGDNGASLSQSIETFGKRSRRMAMADQSVRIAEAEYQDRVTQLTYAVKSSYADLLAEQRKLKIIDELLASYRHTLQLTEARVREGDVASLEAQLLKVEISRAAILRSSTQSRFITTELELRRLAGLSVAQSLPDADFAAPPSTDLDALKRKALEERPDLRIAEMNEARKKVGIALAHAEARPDVTLSAGWSRQSSAFDGLYGLTAQGASRPIREQNSTLNFGIFVPLRTSRSSLGNLQSATARASATRAHREALEQSIPLEVESAYQRWQVATQNVATLQRDVLSPSAVNLSILQKSYKLGQLRMIDILNEQRRLLDAQLTAIDAQQDAQRTWAELERTHTRSCPTRRSFALAPRAHDRHGRQLWFCSDGFFARRRCGSTASTRHGCNWWTYYLDLAYAAGSSFRVSINRETKSRKAEDNKHLSAEA